MTTMVKNRFYMKTKDRKGRASGVQKRHALNTSEGYISGFVKHTLSIRAFGDPLVRARKGGI